MPFPITPLVAFAYFLLHRLGTISAEVLCRYAAASSAEAAASTLGDGIFLNLAAFSRYQQLAQMIAKAETKRHRMLKRLLTYCASGDPLKGHKFQRWLVRMSLATNDPAAVLAKAKDLLTSWLEIGFDPWESSPRKYLKAPARLKPPAYPPDRRILTLPVFKGHEHDEGGGREITAQARFELVQGKIFELTQAHIGIAIGGPQGSGKSTLTASLVAETKNNAEELATRLGWEKFGPKIAAVDLDLATPTLEAIAAGKGWERKKLAGLKRPWTTELALEAHRLFVEAKAQNNIVFADLPGGSISEITEIVAAPADAAILLSWNWDLMPEWEKFIKRMGITLISRAMSYRSDESSGLTSVMRRYEPGRLFTGRIVGLERVERSWDRFISWLAEFLLYGILPAHVADRRDELDHLLDEIEET